MRQRARTASVLGALAIAIAACTSTADPGELSVYGPYTGPEADIFGEVLEEFEQETGIAVNYVGSSSFQLDFPERVSTGDLDDVTILPQPAQLGAMIDNGLAVAVSTDAATTILGDSGDAWAPIISRDGEIFAAPYRFVVKSLVWYRADVFEDHGYEVPETLDELLALATTMMADGFHPWCGGMDDGLTTGWWVTDWVEDLVLRRAGVETYNSWLTLQTPFTDPVIVDAMAEVQETLTAEGAVDGGRRTILNTFVSEAMDPMFETEPACLMHKQASFQPFWFPTGLEYGDPEVGVFGMPPLRPGPAPMLISGELAVATSDKPEVSLLLAYLGGDEAFDPWRQIGGSLKATSEFDPDVFDDPLDRTLIDLLDSAEVASFDASDLMPPSIGTSAFFEGMVDLISGVPPAEVAAAIQSQVDALEVDDQ